MYYYHDHGRILTIELLPNTRRISFIHKKENYEVLVEDGNRSEKQGYLGWVSTEIPTVVKCLIGFLIIVKAIIIIPSVLFWGKMRRWKIMPMARLSTCLKVVTCKVM